MNVPLWVVPVAVVALVGGMVFIILPLLGTIHRNQNLAAAARRNTPPAGPASVIGPPAPPAPTPAAGGVKKLGRWLKSHWPSFATVLLLILVIFLVPDILLWTMPFLISSGKLIALCLVILLFVLIWRDLVWRVVKSRAFLTILVLVVAVLLFVPRDSYQRWTTSITNLFAEGGAVAARTTTSVNVQGLAHGEATRVVINPAHTLTVRGFGSNFTQICPVLNSADRDALLRTGLYGENIHVGHNLLDWQASPAVRARFADRPLVVDVYHLRAGQRGC